jgi:hypothetical protein
MAAICPHRARKAAGKKNNFIQIQLHVSGLEMSIELGIYTLELGSNLAGRLKGLVEDKIPDAMYSSAGLSWAALFPGSRVVAMKLMHVSCVE